MCVCACLRVLCELCKLLEMRERERERERERGREEMLVGFVFQLFEK